MQFRALILASATLAVVPALSHAAAETKALDACTQAFATSIAAPGAAAPSVKVNYHSTSNRSSFADYYARGFSFTLNAFDSKTGLLIARATCTTGNSAEVIALLTTPIDRPTTTLAQR